MAIGVVSLHRLGLRRGASTLMASSYVPLYAKSNYLYVKHTNFGKFSHTVQKRNSTERARFQNNNQGGKLMKNIA